MSHAFVTIVIPFDPDNIDDVNTELKKLVDNARGNQPETKLRNALDETGILHFMSMAVVDPMRDDALCRPKKPDLLAHLPVAVLKARFNDPAKPARKRGRG